MTRKVADNLSLVGFALMLAKADPQSSDPAGLGAGDEGRFWYNSTAKVFKFWNGTTAINVLDLAQSSGNLTASRISDFATAAAALRLDQFAAPTSDLNFNARKLTNVADGTAGTDVATYGQLLAFVNNQVFKTPVRAATTANITLSAPQTIDGVAVVAGDRVLVKDQTTGATNGIYVVNAGAWARAEDFNTTAEAVPASVVGVAEGTANADKLFMLTTNGPITLGTTALAFSAYGASSGEIGVGGAGMTKTGTTYDVGAGTTGTISVGTDAIDVNTARVPRKWTGTVPTASATVDGLPITIAGAVVTFNHAANNPAPAVHIFAGSSPVAGFTAGEEVLMGSPQRVDNNNYRVTLPAAPSTNNWDFGVYA